MASLTRAGSRHGERGFTLAGVIVLVTIVMIFAAYTIPRQWSTIMKRERERQTIYAMQQYAKAITAFRIKNGNAYPTSPQQLKDARQPRLIRGLKGELVDALTGEVDWLVIPQSAAGALPQHNIAGNPNNPQGAPPPPPPTQTQTTDTSSTNPQAKPGLPGIPIKDYAGGPFIGVRPAAHGKSLLTLLGADTYETWVYTSLDYEQEKALRINAAGTVFR
ncbi:MAG: type II secretion system GspH family protein [Acidobacteriota bacterium]|nr:type II secretion system GspH family protein [Acidobacteriota bacterium]